MGRRRKGYAQLSNGFFEDTKIRKALKVNPRAGLLFVMSIAFSSSNLTDGHITVDDAEYVLGASQDDIGYLTAEGLWVESDDGWDIHNYLKYNLSSDRVMSRLEADKSRKSISVRNPDGKGTESVRNPDDFRADVNKEQRTENNNPPLTPPIGEGTQTGMLTEDLLFEEAWEAYPRHTGSKRRTRSLFVTMDELPSIVEAAREMRRRVDAGELEARYVPSMSRWLENGAYSDCMPKPSKPGFPEPGWVQSHVFAHLPDGCDTFQAQRRLWALIRDGTTWDAAAATVIAENGPADGRTDADPHKDAHQS